MDRYIDHHSFLVNNNLFTEEMKDNIAMAGYCIIEDTKDVETVIDFNNNTVAYQLLLPGELYNNLKLLEKFESGENIGFWNSIRLKKFLKKKREIEEAENTGMLGYQLELIANKFLKAYLNDGWSASVEIFNADNEDESKNFGLRSPGDKQTD